MHQSDKPNQPLFNEAIKDPSLFFQHPCRVLEDDRFDVAQKKQILRQWEYDVREMMVAEEEGMNPDPQALALHQANLGEILRCLHQLGVDVDIEHAQTSKFGGV